MIPPKFRRLVNPFLYKLSAIVLASILFAASFPNLLVEGGIPLLAWIAFLPVFYVVSRVSFRSSFFWGALYGYLSYGLYNYWLTMFHPLAGIIVGVIYLVYLMLLFPLLKLVTFLFPKKGYIVQFLLWMAYEYLKTKGFVGYAYGISGYTQWSVLPLIQIASITGVWGVSALVVFPSVYGAAAIKDGFDSIPRFLKREWLPGLLWVGALLGSLIYGYNAQIDYSEAPTKHIALIQNNADPWRGDLQIYRSNFEVSKRLSLEALKQIPKPDLMVWSETAFIPRIYWHHTYREPGQHDSYLLVKDLLNFLAEQDVPYVIGNDDARLEVSPEGSWERVDYNAVILYEGGIEQAVYRKLHLVPFTEHFPYEKQLPWIYKALAEADTHFWKKGTEATVFEAAGIKFSTPICFEDTFGYISRLFTQEGAELIVNLTNDAWAGSLPSQMQHAIMAVFRAVENRRSVVRATASGQTCGIDPNGKILAMAPPFVESQLVVEVPILNTTTLYTRYGDYLGGLFILLSGLCLVIASVFRLIRWISRKGVSIDKM